MPYKSYTRDMNEYMKRRYEERRQRAIERLGGKCVGCGTRDNLELDHKDPSTKSFSFAKIWSYSLNKFDKELEKAQLLCVDCHKKKTKKENRIKYLLNKYK